ALNFSWGCEDDTNTICYKINATGTNAKIAAFCCPSDPNAGVPDHNNTPNTNNYYMSVGTTMNWSTIGTGNVKDLNMPSTGLFTWQRAYGVRDCTDGTSNTIALAEAVVGNQSLQPGQRRIGLQNIGALQPFETVDGSLNPTNTK